MSQPAPYGMRVRSDVLLAVEHALEQDAGNRRGYLDGLRELDEESRQTAHRLLAECEAIEREDSAPDARSIEETESDDEQGSDGGGFPIALGELLAVLPAESASVSCAHRLEVEATIGPFRVSRFVAAGGMGEVYEAIDRRVGRRVALKTMPLYSGAERSHRFEREAMLMARLEHPSIARLYEWGVSTTNAESGRPGVPYIAMEFVEGRPLREAAAELRANRQGAGAIVELLLPVIDAVAHAHARGVLHRDIKPSNILVDERGVPRLLDFGVAALIDDGTGDALTMTESAAPGTLTYMSPEQARGGARRVTTRSDVYALGLLLHELIRGVPVVDAAGKGIAELIEEVLQRDPPPLFPRASRESADLEFVVRKALAKEPRDRYGSADALAEDLRRVGRGESPLGREIGTLELLKRVVWRRRKMIAPAFAALVVLAAVAALGAAQYVRAREAEARSDVLIGQLLEGSKPLVQDLHQRLVAEDQPLAARKAALEATAAYLEWVQANAQNDERVLAEVAACYDRLARVAGTTGDTSLGDTSVASDYYARSRAILDSLLDSLVIRRVAVSNAASVELRRQLLLLRANVLVGSAGLRPFEERSPYFALASRDQREAVALMPMGPERDDAERLFLITEVKGARVAFDLVALEIPLTRMREMAGKPRFGWNAEFLSELGLAERYYADVLENDGRIEEAIRAATEAKQMFERSIALGQDDFTNRRHLARVELLIGGRTAAERTLGETLDLLLAALERSQSATNLQPHNSFHRLSHIEMVELFTTMTRIVVEQVQRQDAGREAVDLKDVREAVRIALHAIDEHGAFATSLPIEGAPHRGEPALLEQIAAGRDFLARLLETAPVGESPGN